MNLETKLYDEQGRFKFVKRQLGICVLCREKDYTYDVGALDATARFCKRCIVKGRPEELRRDANIALSRAKRAVTKTTDEMKTLNARYQERFGTSIRWVKPGDSPEPEAASKLVIVP